MLKPKTILRTIFFQTLLILLSINLYVKLEKLQRQQQPNQCLLTICQKPMESKSTGVKYATNRARASWYDRRVCKHGTYGTTCKTANGSIFNDQLDTMACTSDLPFGTRVELCRGNVCVVAICTDRGGYEYLYPNRKFDLTRSLFNKLGPESMGIMEVNWKLR